MLFDLRPKERRGDLFDRERELEALVRGLERHPIVLVLGPRRVGKTSLIRVAVGEASARHVILDVRSLYFEHGPVPKSVLAARISSSFGLGETRSLLEALSELDAAGGGIICLDEAQYLRLGGVDYRTILAWAADYLGKVRIIVTGSEGGILRDFMALEDPRSPLYGRGIMELNIGPFTEDQAIEFLLRGAEELGKSCDREEAREVVETVGTIPGWLTLYGHLRFVREMGREEALRRTFSEGSRMALAEINPIIEPSRKRYMAILRAVAAGLRTWKDIKAFTEARAGPISDFRFTNLLKRLLKYGILRKREGIYEFQDRILERAIREYGSGRRI